MKNYILCLFLFLVSFSSFAQDEILSNESVISMVTSKVPKKLILTKISSTNNSFDLSTDAIISLSKTINSSGNLFTKYPNEDVILAMLESPKSKSFQPEKLTNETVILMTNSKISKKIILSKIKLSDNKFDFSTEGLINLTKNKVANDVQDAMIAQNKVLKIEKNSITNQVPDKKYSKPTDFSKINKPGIYYFNGNNNSFTKLDPNVFSSNKEKGAFLNKAVSGFFKVKAKATLNGSNANFQFIDNEVTFYFFFSKEVKSGKEMERDLLESAESPNEFTLAKFKTQANKNIREVELGSSSSDGTSYGINEEQVISFKYEQINQNLYKVYFPKALISGEYCFMPTVNSATQGKSSKMFDFSIKTE